MSHNVSLIWTIANWSLETNFYLGGTILFDNGGSWGDMFDLKNSFRGSNHPVIDMVHTRLAVDRRPWSVGCLSSFGVWRKPKLDNRTAPLSWVMKRVGVL